MQGGNYDRATGSRCDIFGYKQEQSKKTKNVTQKNENEHTQIDVTRGFTQQKQTSTKRATKIIKKSYNKAKEQAGIIIIIISRL